MSAAIHARVLARRAAVAQARAEEARRQEFLDAARGEQGPAGPMPDHEWKGTKLRFQKPDGTWGKWVDLRGTAGKDGKDGAIVVRGGGAPREDTEMPYAKRVDFVSQTEFYKGEAPPGADESAPVWRIAHVVIGPDGDVNQQWAGEGRFEFAWSDRATITYT